MGLGWTQNLPQNHSFHPRFPATALLEGPQSWKVTTKEDTYTPGADLGFTYPYTTSEDKEAIILITAINKPHVKPVKVPR